MSAANRRGNWKAANSSERNSANLKKGREKPELSGGSDLPRRNWLLADVRNANDNKKRAASRFPAEFRPFLAASWSPAGTVP
jgi:hypothetical protein